MDARAPDLLGTEQVSEQQDGPSEELVEVRITGVSSVPNDRLKDQTVGPGVVAVPPAHVVEERFDVHVRSSQCDVCPPHGVLRDGQRDPCSVRTAG